MVQISLLLKQLCYCGHDIRFFSLILVGVSFCNSFQLYVFFPFCALICTEDSFTISEPYFKSVYYSKLHCCIPRYYREHIQFDHILCFFFFFAIDIYLSCWKLLLKHMQYQGPILEIDLVSLKAMRSKKQCNIQNNHVHVNQTVL